MALTQNPIARALLENHWNEKFSSWHRPPSDSEEERIERAARMIRGAIRADGRIPNDAVEVIPQGSYRNNTNRRLNSDMDICVRYNPQLWYYIPPATNLTPADINVTPLPESTVEATARHLRLLLYSVLENIGQVTWGKTALKVASVEGSRVDADVVPALAYWLVRPGLLLSPFSIEKGTAILTDDGRWLFNFPEQHYRRGVEKNDRTGRRYKRTVRILKSLGDELRLDSPPPSFMVESLAYNCPDWAFTCDTEWYETVPMVLAWIHKATSDASAAANLVEANGIKPLFADGQPWSLNRANAFAVAALLKIL